MFYLARYSIKIIGLYKITIAELCVFLYPIRCSDVACIVLIFLSDNNTVFYEMFTDVLGLLGNKL